MKGHVMKIKVPDGAFDAYVSRPSAQLAPVGLVLPEIFGVNDDL